MARDTPGFLFFLTGCVAVLGCGVSHRGLGIEVDVGGAGDGTSSDASAIGEPPDATTAPDASSSPTPGLVECLADRCLVDRELCCVTASASFCASRSTSCPGAARRCDGPEDCPTGNVCCARVEGNTYHSACLKLTDCTDNGGAPLCRSSIECPSALRSCAPAGVVRLCHRP